MSTALLVLISILPGDGPAPTSTQMHQATLAELLSGSWSGTWTREGPTDAGAAVHKGMFTIPMNPPAKMRLTITEEGRGWFRGRVSSQPIVGIWRYQRGVLTICENEADKGFPKDFEATEQRDLAVSGCHFQSSQSLQFSDLIVLIAES
jgi:hypothetical protein